MFGRKKIKENKTKPGLYGNRYNQKNDFSVWDSMSIIEQFVLVVMPCLLVFIFYIMLDMTGMIWWLRLVISIGIVGLLMGLITLIVNYFHEM
tara:strand:- start:60 stop:335 length:276 start_codon:yes stop_codon:yes gene_type:complete